ncbi:unnamed protein product [Amoebophrya sp. A120]|nr:unnamed protein product [Amoebophrya sp. A120]|eukprot:GSA120T00019203001.1
MKRNRSVSGVPMIPVLNPLHSYAQLFPTFGKGLYRSPKDFPQDWEVLKQLGTANFGKVFLLRHKPTNQEFAVKRMATDERNADGHISRTGVLERYTQRGEGENAIVELGVYTYCSFGKNLDRKLNYLRENKDLETLGELKGGESMVQDVLDQTKKDMALVLVNRGRSGGFSDVMGGTNVNNLHLDEVYYSTPAGAKTFAKNLGNDPRPNGDSLVMGEVNVPFVSGGSDAIMRNKFNVPFNEGEQTGAPDLSTNLESTELDDSEYAPPYWMEHKPCPNLLRMSFCLMDNEYVYVGTEKCTRGELFELVAAKKRLGEALCRCYLRQVCEAVLWLHDRGIGHRDISLENILLTDEPEDRCIRLMDFGMSCNLYRERTDDEQAAAEAAAAAGNKSTADGTTRLTEANHDASELQPKVARTAGKVRLSESGRELEDVHYSGSVGKDLYRPPELYHGTQQNFYKVAPVDVFCCGVVFFMMLTGKPLWRRCTMSDKVTAFLAEGGAARFDSNWQRLVDGWGFRERFSADALDLIPKMVHFDPGRRWSIPEILKHPFFIEPEGDGKTDL